MKWTTSERNGETVWLQRCLSLSWEITDRLRNDGQSKNNNKHSALNYSVTSKSSILKCTCITSTTVNKQQLRPTNTIWPWSWAHTAAESLCSCWGCRCSLRSPAAPGWFPRSPSEPPCAAPCRLYRYAGPDGTFGGRSTPTPSHTDTQRTAWAPSQHTNNHCHYRLSNPSQPAATDWINLYFSFFSV